MIPIGPCTSWPPGSVTEVMTVRWPGHGPFDPPDVDARLARLATRETFWILRATGSLRSAELTVKGSQLRAGVDLAACAAEHGILDGDDADDDDFAIPVQDARVAAAQRLRQRTAGGDADAGVREGVAGGRAAGGVDHQVAGQRQ